MKKIILLITLLITFTLSSQNQITMTTDLERYVIDVINEGLKHNVSIMDSLVKKVDYILIDDMDSNIGGSFYKEDRTILISSSILMDTTLTKSVVYHEIGHALINDEHICYDCPEIMSELEYYYIDKEYYVEKWDDIIGRYFEYINKNLYKNEKN